MRQLRKAMTESWEYDNPLEMRDHQPKMFAAGWKAVDRHYYAKQGATGRAVAVVYELRDDCVHSTYGHNDDGGSMYCLGCGKEWGST